MKKNVYSMTFDQQFVDGADNMANFMLDMKSIKAIPKTESYMDTTLLKKVFPEDVTIK